MAPKRDAPEAPLDGPAKKRQRMREQRTIPVQAGRAGGSAGSGPPRPNKEADWINAHKLMLLAGNTTLPPTIEVEKFAQARLFEINALQRAMKNAKAANTVRAFQSLPRSLRRRAASHNIRRLPSRLREKAMSEVPKDAAKPKRKTRKLVGRKATYKMTRPLRLLKRQTKKVWLETHIWHAKRMHMTEIWGHRIAVKPTEKAFRSSYRASYHGALLHDASYFQYIRLEGYENELKAMLLNVCPNPAQPNPTSKRYTTGTRECFTEIYAECRGYKLADTRHNIFGFDSCLNLLGPATILWDTPAPSAAGSPSRRVLIRVHPAMCESVYKAISPKPLSLRAIDSGKWPKVSRCEKEYLTFEITGKRATEVVKGVLQPVVGTDAATKKVWSSLSTEAGPAGVPRGMILGLEVYDPRLSFPPKLNHSEPSNKTAFSLQPSAETARVSTFWDTKHLASLRKPTFTKAMIDKRRSELLMPGAKLPPGADDQRIPILLSQRTVSPPPLTSSCSSQPSDEMCGWTLTIPSGWGMAFWSSLVHTQSRVGGLRERGQQSFEASAPRFPEDYPETGAFLEYEIRRASEEQAYWERRPPAKRPNYDKLGTPDPFSSAFGRQGKDRGDSSTFSVPGAAVELVVRKLLMLDSDLPTAPAMTQLVDSLEMRVRQSEYLTPGGLVRVKVVPVGRGAPEELAMIYEVSEEQRVKLVHALQQGEQFDVVEVLGETPPASQAIGRVTTGHYSLKEGHGSAVGSVGLVRFVKLCLRDHELQVKANAEKLLVLVRNRDSETFRVANLKLMP